MSSELAVRITNISKCYPIYDTPQNRLKQFVWPRLQHMTGVPVKRYYQEFWALQDVSFEVKKGETVGIIGRNGSGKSTLLQIVCGVLTQTSGEIEKVGRVGALLELGSGFNPEFSGRENVYLNGAILGLKKADIDARFDDIVNFADIGAFVDQPIKSYSSGMVVRLAFAVQSQMDPDILIVDEALAVGDAKFQAKCFDRLKQLKQRGTSILLVTHSSEQIVTHCNRAALLDAGKLQMIGDPRDVVNRYVDLLFGRPIIREVAGDAGDSAVSSNTKPIDGGVKDQDVVHQETLNFLFDVFASRSGYNPYEYRWGDKQAAILDYSIQSSDEMYPAQITSGDRVKLCIACSVNAMVVRPIFGVTIKNKEGVTLFGTNSELQICAEIYETAGSEVKARVFFEFSCCLGAGDYFISLGIASANGEAIVPHDRRYDAIHFIVAPVNQFFGLANLQASLRMERISE